MFYQNFSLFFSNDFFSALRTEEGGFWHKDIYPHQMWLDGLYMAEPFYADDFGNYPEASCSAMFTYFMLKSTNNGYLPELYFTNAKKAFYSIIRQFIDIDPNKYLNLKDTVYVSGLGGNKMRDGSYEYYISEPKQTNNLLGIGAFIMASIELEKKLIENVANS